MAAIEKRITNNKPPVRRQIYERLLREGRSENDAKVLISNIGAMEIFEVVYRREPYHNERFVQVLSRLPERPDE